MDKESGEQTSKTLFSARDCNTTTAAALFILLYFIFFSNPAKILFFMGGRTSEG